MAGETIVVIDDEPHIVDMFSTFLQIKGYVPRGAYSGEDGLTLIQVENPQAVLLDLMLPDLQGDEVLKRLRANPATANLPVLIVSAKADDRTQRQLLDQGANGFLKKPVAFPNLIAQLEQILAAATPAAPSPPAAPPTPPPAAKPAPPPTIKLDNTAAPPQPTNKPDASGS